MDRQFPPEIIQLIVEASLEPFDIFDWSLTKSTRRYSTLKSYALLNSAWRGVSESSLYEIVVIRTENAALSFLEVAKNRGGLMEYARDLEIRWVDLDDSIATRIFSVVPHTVNLFLAECWVDFGDLRHLQQLYRLEMATVDITGSTGASTFCIPSLKRLSLFDCPIPQSADHFFTPSVFPKLRHLELYNTPATVDSLIHQLEAVSFQSIDGHSFSGARSLQLLLIPYSSDMSDTVLSQLPSLPPFISIDFEAVYWRDDFAGEVIDALEQLLACPKEGLRVIFLRKMGIDAAAKALIKQLEGRAIRVVRAKRTLDINDALLAMERILTEEKQAAEKEESNKK